MRRVGLMVSVLCVFSACDTSSTGGDDLIVIPDSSLDMSPMPDMNRAADMRIRTDTLQRPDDMAPVLVDASVDVLVDAAPDAFFAKACNDEIDNDSDNLIDYPRDPGCSDLSDDNELDPDSPACGDEEDNDEDGLVDHPDDPGCSDPNDVSENNLCNGQRTFIDVTGQTQITGTTEGEPADFNVCRNNDAPEKIYLFTLRESVGRLRIDTRGSDFDTLLGVWRQCDDANSEIACNDDVGAGSRTSEVVISSPVFGDYYILVDGHGTSSGAFQINIRGEQPIGFPCNENADPDDWISCGVEAVCRNGTCQAAQCADGADNDGDGVIDYPNDAGCTATNDDDETVPEPRPQCGDFQDNDFDGRIDYPTDPDCTSAGDDDESSPPPCSDGRDNDGDGLIDLDDPGCQGDPERFSEFNLPACRNNVDDDEDMLVDFPFDPGCADRNDDDETDPEEPGECHDGIDNDEDGLTDYPDDAESCLYAADPTENDPCIGLMPREVTGLSRTRGNTAEKANDFQGSCRQPTDKEDVLLWRVTEGRALQGLVLDTRDSDFDTNLYVRTSCSADTEIACDDNGGAAFTSRVELGPQPVGTALYIFVDGAAGSAGIWRLRLTGKLAAGQDCGGRQDYVCGDGLTCEETPDGQRCVRAPCDDGQDNDADGHTDFPNDPGCDAPSDLDETDPPVPPACSNGVDDDGDGLMDFGFDDRCDSAADDYEGPDCSDGIDNDQDGAIDYDRDGDGNGGPNRDPECVCANDPVEADQPDCADHCDNDRDGLVDLEDPGCQGDPNRNSEFNAPQCRDLIDNNGDGRIDYPNDPSCTFQDAPLERDVPQMPLCADMIDNDADGQIDYPADPGCTSAADNDERPSCQSDIEVFPNANSVAGDTFNAMAETNGSCGFDGGSPEAVYRVPVPYPGLVVVDTVGSNFNTVLYARSACEAMSVCAPDVPADPDAGLPDAHMVDMGSEDAEVADAGPRDANMSDAGDAARDLSVVDAAPALDASAQNDAARAPQDSALTLDAGMANPSDSGQEQGDASQEQGDANHTGNNDPGDELPCVPEDTQLACNDNAVGALSRINFDWSGGDFYLFIDGFGRAFGQYRAQLQVTYPRNGQCGPEMYQYAACEIGTQCLLDAVRGIPTCQ